MGLASVVALLAESASVLMADVQAEAGQARAEELRKTQGTRIAFQRADVCGTAEVEAAIEKAVSLWGGLDILVNVVGINDVKALEQTTDEDFARIVDTNLRGTLAAIRAAVPPMRRRGGGSIISIGSVHGDAGFGNHHLYTMCKAGLNGLTKELAFTLGPSRIRVNVVSPGYISSHKGPREIAATLRPDAKEEFWKEWAALYPVSYAFTQPLHRACHSEDVANIVAFLATDKSQCLTGEVLHVDGGLSISMFQSQGRSEFTAARQDAEARWKAWYQAHKV